jgi:hypothetical protein
MKKRVQPGHCFVPVQYMSVRQQYWLALQHTLTQNGRPGEYELHPFQQYCLARYQAPWWQTSLNYVLTRSAMQALRKSELPSEKTLAGQDLRLYRRTEDSDIYISSAARTRTYAVERQRAEEMVEALEKVNAINTELQRSTLVQDNSLLHLSYITVPSTYISYPPMIWGPHSRIVNQFVDSNMRNIFQPMAQAANAKFFFDIHYSSLYGSLTNPSSTPFCQLKLPVPGRLAPDILLIDSQTQEYSLPSVTVDTLVQYTVTNRCVAPCTPKVVVQWSTHTVPPVTSTCEAEFGSCMAQSDYCAYEKQYSTDAELEAILACIQEQMQVKLVPAMFRPASSAPPPAVAVRQVRSHLLALQTTLSGKTSFVNLEDLVLSPRSSTSSDVPVYGGLLYTLYDNVRTIIAVTALAPDTASGEQYYYAVLYSRNNMQYLRRQYFGKTGDEEQLNDNVHFNYILVKVPVAKLGLLQKMNSALRPFSRGSKHILAFIPMTVSTEQASAGHQALTYLGYHTMPVPPPPLEELDWSAVAVDLADPTEVVHWKQYARFTLPELQYRLKLVSGKASSSQVTEAGVSRSTLQGVLVLD